MATGGRDQAVPSSQGYNPSRANGGNGPLQGPQQYPQAGHQQTGSQDWEATGGLSPSQQLAVQELTEMGFDSRQAQVCHPSLGCRETVFLFLSMLTHRADTLVLSVKAVSLCLSIMILLGGRSHCPWTPLTMWQVI